MYMGPEYVLSMQAKLLSERVSSKQDSYLEPVHLEVARRIRISHLCLSPAILSEKREYLLLKSGSEQVITELKITI